MNDTYKQYAHGILVHTTDDSKPRLKVEDLVGQSATDEASASEFQSGDSVAHDADGNPIRYDADGNAIPLELDEDGNPVVAGDHAPDADEVFEVNEDGHLVDAEGNVVLDDAGNPIVASDIPEVDEDGNPVTPTAE